jgi:hypothetical protein
MNRLLKFVCILLAVLAAGMAASQANIVVDPTESTLSGTISGTATTMGDFTVSGTGKAIGATVSGGLFAIPNGSFTLNITPDLSTAGNQFFPLSTNYGVAVTWSGGNVNTTLSITVNGVTQTATSGQLLTFAGTPTSTVLLQFGGSGNGNNITISNINVVSLTPEPRSITAALFVMGGICWVERRRIGGRIAAIGKKTASAGQDSV